MNSSKRTRDLTINHVQARDLGYIQVKGFSEPVQVFGVEKMIDRTGSTNAWQTDNRRQAGFR